MKFKKGDLVVIDRGTLIGEKKGIYDSIGPNDCLRIKITKNFPKQWHKDSEGLTDVHKTRVKLDTFNTPLMRELNEL